MKNIRLILLPLALLCFAGVAAQTTLNDIAADPDRSAGIYHSYHYQPGPDAPAPEGYVPFYISHYGRHGSRWHASESKYTDPLNLLREAAAQGQLTEKGQDLLCRVERIAADADERWGDLSPRGVEEHRGIAERMYSAYPEVFSTDNGRECLVESRSTLVPRVILSMAAFNERLKELNPAIRTTREASRRYMGYLANSTGLDARHKAASAVRDSLRLASLHPARLMRTIFKDPDFAGAAGRQPQRVMYDLFMLAANMQDVDYLGISLYDLFTDEELYALWQYENAYRYLSFGPSARFGDTIVADARPLLRNIVETAQEVIDGEKQMAASLRFGHDVHLMPLVALLGIEGASARVAAEDVWKVWDVSRVSPMAANVQFIFFRNPSTGDVRVRVLHNERDAKLPLAGGPYYPWKELRAYCEALYQ